MSWTKSDKDFVLSVILSPSVFKVRTRVNVVYYAHILRSLQAEDVFRCVIVNCLVVKLWQR